MTPVELLAPARDLPTALEAIAHGADAVYIGGPSFGARSSASNTVEDIGELCLRAHQYRVRVYVTLNTLLYDDELPAALDLIHQLNDVGVDALIVQDMSLMEMPLPPIALHASTQMDISTPEHVRWLSSLGFRQVVLARELSLDEIRLIHEAAPGVRLEAFAHGSICVSRNGQCYASQHCFGRSANRGECAQFCRLPFSLVDGEGRVLARQRHLLSLRDMNRGAYVEEMLDAGVVSFKIEGRLKDVGYVKVTVAHYRRLLDEVIARRPHDFCRSSLGESLVGFRPRVGAVFNRGFTDYFLHGRTSPMANTLSPANVGEAVGTVERVGERCVVVGEAEGVEFANGDGLCFYDGDGTLQGFRLNRAEGLTLYPRQMPQGLRVGMPLFRNHDQRLEALLAHPSAQRRIPVRWTLSETSGGFSLSLSVEGEHLSVNRHFPCPHTPALSPQGDRIAGQLSRLGGSPLRSLGVEMETRGEWFIPVSVLNSWRRLMVEELMRLIASHPVPEASPSAANASTPVSKASFPAFKASPPTSPVPAPFRGQNVTYRGNVANSLAERFFLRQGALSVEKAMEVATPTSPGRTVLMTCRYCLLHELGHCLREGEPSFKLPLRLCLADGREFPLGFDCRECQMYVYAS